jgi:Tol biopolymer transport system component
MNLYQVNVDGTGKKQLTKAVKEDRPIAFSADGTKLFFTRFKSEEDKTGQMMEIDLATRKAHRYPAAALPLQPGPKVKYEIVTKKTGKKISLSNEGEEWEEDETVDHLFLKSADGKRQQVAEGYHVSVLGWVKE